MGLDPDDNSYEPGDACPLCEAELFDGTTPRHVLAVVQDIEACPGALDPVPNVTRLLTQTDHNPCIWTGIVGGIRVTWELLFDRSRINVWVGDHRYFFADTPLLCHDAFANENICLGADMGFNGYVTLWWGPHIAPPPC